MKTYIARSIFETQAHLESALSADRQARLQGQAWISSHFQANLTTALATLRQCSEAQGLARNQLESIQIQRRKQVDELSHLVRDFFQVLRRRNQRLALGQELEVLHKRPKRMPQWAPVQQWLQWAKDIVSGEELALDRDYPAMINPSAADIQTVLSRALACEQQWAERVQLLKAHEQALRQARDRGIRVLRGLALRLRETLAHEAPPTRRELMRTYGFNFISTGAKERSKAKPGESQLAVLIRPPQTAIDSPEPSSDRDSQAKDSGAMPTSQPESAVAQRAAQIHSPQTPNQPPEPSNESASQAMDGASVATPLLSPRADAQAAPAAGPQLQASTASQAPAAPGKKLSRRQKKALRRAQTKHQSIHAMPSKPEQPNAPNPAPWTLRVPA